VPPIDWDKEFVSLLMYSTRSDFLVPPIVLHENGQPLEGYEGLERFVEGSLPAEQHVVKGATPADLAELDCRMAKLSEEFNVPIGFPDGRRARTSGRRRWWRPWSAS
jgi:hypothetical protein